MLGMELVAGPARSWKHELLAGRVDLDLAAAIGTAMTTLHRMPVPAGLREPAGRDLFEALRTGPYYRTTAARVPQLAPALLRLIADSARASGPVLVHGDLNPKNVVVTSGRPVLLDWEIAHAGDPAFDLGMLTAHLLLKACRSRVGTRPSRRRYGRCRRAYHGPAVPQLAVRHSGAIMAARVHGKSPVDYLQGDGDVARAMAVAAAALADPTPTMDDLLQRMAAPSGADVVATLN